MSFKTEVRARGEQSWHSNALRFRTRKEADAYGEDLYSRWMGAEAVRTAVSRDPVNYVADQYGHARPISANIRVPGEARRRPAHPRGRGDQLSIGARLTRRSGRRRYRGR